MREIGTIDQEKDARVLGDYLLTLDISTKLVGRTDDGPWAIWVHKEDKVPQARQVLEEFRQNPSDQRFHAAAPTAREIRRTAEKTESAYRKRVRSLRDRWEGPLYRRAPFTVALMVLSVLITGLVQSHIQDSPRIWNSLAYSVRTMDDDGSIRDLGLEAIERGEVWRLVTPIFLHGGIAHLFFNMLALMAFGERIEVRKGTLRLVGFVLITAIASNSAQFFSKMEGNFGGISGVVFAMAGYLWVKGQYDPDDHLSLNQQTTNWMLGWFVLGIVASQLAPPNARGFPYNMANVAHGIGLASGMVFGLLRL